MAEQERLTNKERRQVAREERKRKQEEEAKAARRRRAISILSTIVVLGIIGAVVATAFLGDEDVIAEAIVLNSTDVEAAQEAAGCEVLAERQPVAGAATHFPNASAPEADQMYTGDRPAHSGPHFTTPLPIIRRGSDNQLDERGLVHNLEHGSVAAWYDPEKIEDGTKGEMEDWSARLIESGFVEPRAGSGIYVAPYTDPGITSGKAIAFRAWGSAMDCDEWDEEVANAFVLENYGTHGIAPERTFAPFPEDLMRYEDREVGDTSTEEAPVGDTGETTTPTEAEATEDPTATEDATTSEEPTTPEPTETTT